MASITYCIVIEKYSINMTHKHKKYSFAMIIFAN